MVFQAGDVLSDRYEIEESIGEGAFGQVYRARHVLLHNHVAIKVLSTQMQQNQNVSKRFLREAQSVAAIDHPNVCRVLDFGELDDDSFFMVMEFLEGTPLDEYLSTHGWLNANEAISLTIQVCGALEHVHAAGIVHRDIKPENLMLIPQEDAPDTIKLVDFGIAGIIDPEEVDFPTAKLTRQGMIFGTPAYMSPEQSVSGHVDHRTDLYAIGCMLYEMLTGRPPYEADNITALLLKHVSEPIPNLQQHTPKPLPKDLCDIVSTLLAKTPEERFEDAASLKAALLTVESSLTIDDRSTVGGLNTVGAIREPTVPMGTNNAFKDRRTVQDTTRHAKPPIPKEYLIVGGIVASLVALAVIGVIVAVIGSSADSDVTPSTVAPDSKASKQQRKNLAEDRATFLEKPDIKAAMALLSNDAKGALATLKAKEASFPSNPHMHYTLGLAYAQNKNRLAAATSFAESISLEPRYWHDKHTREALDGCLGSRKCAKRMDDVHKKFSRTDALKSLWIARLSLNAREHDSRRVQRAASAALKGNDWLKVLPKWEQEVIGLNSTRSCKGKLSHIKALKTLGEKRALPALESLSKRGKRGCGFLKRSDCLSCLRKPLASTIQLLKK